MINRDNCRRLAEYLRGDVPFFMGAYMVGPELLQLWFDPVAPNSEFIQANGLGPLMAEGSCGTAACIAGHAVLMNGWRERGYATHAVAAEWLGLDEDEAEELFIGRTLALDLEKITKTDAVRHLEMLADGTLDAPDWGLVLREN